jgi:hypothetical protein
MLDLIQFFSSPTGLAAAAILIFLAGLSEGVGTRTSVLLINRITPTVFVLSLLFAALLFLLSAAIWIGGVWLAATRLFGLEDALLDFFYALSVAYTPFLFSALALLPLFGPLIRFLLRLWSFAIGVAVLLPLGLTLWQVVLCAAAGAFLVALIGWLIGEPAAQLGRRLWAGVLRRPLPPLRSELPRVIPGYASGDEAAP